MTATHVLPSDQILARLREHLRRIDAQDWDYFADLRNRTEGNQAVSDLERLARIVKHLEEAAS